MLGVRTNNPEVPVSLNHLAFSANFFHRCLYFHEITKTKTVQPKNKDKTLIFQRLLTFKTAIKP